MINAGAVKRGMLKSKKLPRPLSLGSFQVAWLSSSNKGVIRMKIVRLCLVYGLG